ncbi:ATP-binding protein [Candidatus Odyssella thessalonicensis]|uniref:ATP-binding protein n=1 Tax=Candidatus Odyssella thessalonicensis TaxID=84647 RepID=UPI000225AC52|nr:ATP-binding protein [Candidatus Odyssella thessalonicensis]
MTTLNSFQEKRNYIDLFDDPHTKEGRIIDKILEKYNFGLITLDHQGKILSVSDVLLETVQLQRSAMIGRNLVDFIGDSEFNACFISKLDSLFSSKISNINFTTIWKTNSKRLRLYFELYPCPENSNQISGYSQTVQEASLEQSFKENYAKIINHLGALVWLSFADPKDLHYVSPNFKLYYEMSLEDYLADPSRLLSRIHPEDQDKMLKVYDPHEGAAINYGDFRYLLDDNSWRHITFYRFPIFSTKGEIEKFIGIAMDTTPFHAAEQIAKSEQHHFAQVITELKKSNQLLEEATSFACHDLAQPLRAFKMYTEILESTYLQDTNQEGKCIMQSIKAAVERMHDLVKGIGNLSLLGLSRADLAEEHTNVAELLERTLVPIYASSIKPSCHIDVVQAHPLKVKQEHIAAILENLITNSIKYNQNFPRIQIRSKKFASAVVYTISDNGIGIPKEAEDYIFELGKRLHTKPDALGSGIGLAACRKIMDLYKGKIWCHSQMGQGATFYLLFPKSIR